jgi:alkylation response protein AidB-like acyl-CoA dehydrogenase
MHVEIEAARLLVQHAAWARPGPGADRALEGSTAKLFATEMAQRVVDRALQLPAAGMLKGSTVERLYRSARAQDLRRHQRDPKLVIARQILKERK